jgi:hypothetical protein
MVGGVVVEERPPLIPLVTTLGHRRRANDVSSTVDHRILPKSRGTSGSLAVLLSSTIFDDCLTRKQYKNIRHSAIVYGTHWSYTNTK